MRAEQQHAEPLVQVGRVLGVVAQHERLQAEELLVARVAIEIDAQAGLDAAAAAGAARADADVANGLVAPREVARDSRCCRGSCPSASASPSLIVSRISCRTVSSKNASALALLLVAGGAFPTPSSGWTRPPLGVCSWDCTTATPITAATTMPSRRMVSLLAQRDSAGRDAARAGVCARVAAADRIARCPTLSRGSRGARRVTRRRCLRTAPTWRT